MTLTIWILNGYLTKTYCSNVYAVLSAMSGISTSLGQGTCIINPLLSFFSLL